MLHGHSSPGNLQLTLRVRRSDGRYRWISGAGAPRLLPTGEAVGYVFSCVDIDDRIRAEQALRESRERLQLALEADMMTTLATAVARKNVGHA